MLATAALLCLLRQLSYACYGSSLTLVTAALLCLLRLLSYACYVSSLGSKPDTSQKYKMSNISRSGQHTVARKKYTKKDFQGIG